MQNEYFGDVYMFNGKNILITGGTGTFGKQFVKYIAEHYKPNKIIIFSGCGNLLISLNALEIFLEV